jgi:two-component system, NarL family, nitrate/nitrite response regulator NarL
VSSGEPSTVVVADDHPLYRASVVRAVKQRPELELVGEASDGREALELIRTLRPAIAVVDLRMPGLDGQRILDAVQRDRLGTRVLLLSGALDSATAYSALEAGAAGVLSKTTEVQALTDAMLAIGRGESVIDPELAAGVVSEIRLRAPDDRPVLTEREHQILYRIAEGRSIPEIAKELFLSQSTIKTHVDHLYRKLGVSDRAAAVAQAMRRGIME